jgi:hypothetical protein
MIDIANGGIESASVVSRRTAVMFYSIPIA